MALPKDRSAIEARIEEIEAAMIQPDFWSDPQAAQALIKEHQALKDAREGVGKYDRGGAVLSIYAGAGGDDAEDFAGMLFAMYQKYLEGKGWHWSPLHTHENDHGGFRNLSIEIDAKNVYGRLKHEYGVHRLVRISPFNANQKRHTSFALVEVLPIIEGPGDIEIPEGDLDVSFARSSGPGGQNVNKRETAVRVVHTPTGLSAHVDGERHQHANRDKAVEIIRGKLAALLEREQKEAIHELSQDPGKIEWGNQIRSYVLHPYQLVKDHRTNHEERTVDAVLKNGELDPFIEAAAAME
ncbi:PCRF domain-containing protein [Patescibacteria group bacterium]|jgi:peptide chain release factor 2|nr:PCRF domain-containing protein [Patescibacteria group bacterium]